MSNVCCSPLGRLVDRSIQHRARWTRPLVPNCAMFDSHVTSASLPLRYSVTEMLRLRIFSRTPPPQLASHHVILKRPKYIHRGSGRNFQYNHTSNKNIRSFWSTGPRPPPRTARTVSPVNHSVLSPLLKATCYTPLTCLKLSAEHQIPQ
ncbi:unnamed protein product [Arctogadus glacialis]